MIKENPFYILGLNPDVIRGLNDAEIKILVDSAYRTLQKIHHPTISGDRRGEEISRKLSDARDKLDQTDYENYRTYKQDFLITRKERILDLEAKLQTLGLKYDRLDKLFLDYLINFSDLDKSPLNVFNFRGKIRMHDYEKFLLESRYINSMRPSTRIFYELSFEKDLVVKKGDDSKKIVCPNKALIGIIDEQTCRINQGANSILGSARYFRTDEQERDARIPRDKMLGGRFRPKKDIVPYSNRIEPEGFGRIIHLLNPYLSPHSLLFSINKDEKGYYFSLEGKIVKIN